MTKKLHDELADYLINAVNSFRSDPAGTDYQKGYLAALEEVAGYFNIVTDNPRPSLKVVK